jgi:glycosyltransferase involved in cell wall biosynthesis
MKVALVHDYLKEYGGAERVLETLHEIWPEAPIYTIVNSKLKAQSSKLIREKFSDCDIRESWLGRIPLAEKLLSLLRILSPLGFASFDFSKFDLVIVSATGAYFPNWIKTKPGALQFCYCHTPPRYLYGYPTARDWKKHWWGRVLGETANHFLRQIDYLSYQRPNFIIANSQNTAARIWKFYRREATVIYPPVEIPKVSIAVNLRGWQKGGYFLAGGRLARAKRVDLAVAACTNLRLPLKVFGRAFAGYEDELRAMAGPTVEFLGEVADEEKSRLMAGCRAFIFPAEEEDFGMTPVEAMAHGKPVIALRQGGVLESVVEGKTGTFFDEPTAESLMGALREFGDLGGRIKPEDCREQARKFSKERFKKEILEFLDSHGFKTD